MRNYIFVLISALFSIQSFSQELKVVYKPPLLPISISYGTDGLKLSLSPTIVTPIGSFSFVYTQKIWDNEQIKKDYFIEKQIEKNDLLVIIRDSKVGNDKHYKIIGGREFNLKADGEIEIRAKEGILIIDLNKVPFYKLNVEGEGSSESFYYADRKKITINSNPDDVDLYIDNILIGRTPCQVELYKPQHEIRLIHENYRNFTKVVSISDFEKNYNFELEPSKPQLTINSNPSNADIFIDGKYVGQTPGNVFVDENQHKLKLKKKSYRTLNRSIDAYKDETFDYNLKLSAILGFGARFDAESVKGLEMALQWPELKGVVFGFGYSNEKNRDLPSYLTFHELENFSFKYDLTQTEKTYISSAQKFHFKIGFSIISERLFIMPGVGILDNYLYNVYESTSEQYIGQYLVHKGDFVSFTQQANATTLQYTAETDFFYSVGCLLNLGLLVATFDYYPGKNITVPYSIGIMLNIMRGYKNEPQTATRTNFNPYYNPGYPTNYNRRPVNSGNSIYRR